MTNYALAGDELAKKGIRYNSIRLWQEISASANKTSGPQPF